MGTIQSSVGLITGFPIQDTINQLISLSGQPRDRLQARTQAIQQEQVAITELTALVVGLELSSAGFGKEELFAGTTATSSNANALSVTQTQDIVNNQEQQVRVRQLAQTNAFGSRDLGSATQSLGYNGRLTIETGGFIDQSVSLDDLNGGRGAERGEIRITDRSGAVATIDLTSAATIDDVLNAINESTDVRVRASTSGDKITLTDLTGETTANLSVGEVGGGATAADLGLRGINVASDSATGLDIDSLSVSNRLDSLRDGRGLGFGSGDDINVTLRDGTELSIDFSDFSREASTASGTTDAIDANARVSIETIAEGGEYDGLEVVFVNDDSITSGNETAELLEGSFGKQLVFRIDEGNSTATNIADALAADSTLSELFSATAGGDGSAAVSADDYAVVSGGSAIDAQTDPTIEDLLRVINSTDSNLRASLSSTGDSILFEDLSRGVGNFEIADADGSTAASDLGLVQSVAADSATGSKLRSGLQSVSLDSLAGGAGLGTLGTLSITTRDGSSANVDLSSAETVADVLSAINASGLDLEASYNNQGTGIALRDLTGGSASNLIVTSGDDTAASLGLEFDAADSFAAGKALQAQYVSRNTKLEDLNQGQGVGEGGFSIVDASGQTGNVNISVLESKTVGGLIDRINALGIGVTASINSSGNGIQLLDTSDSDGSLTITDTGSSTSAEQLGLAGTSQTQVIDGQIKKAIVGSQAVSINVTADDTVATIAEKIASSSGAATASSSGGRLEILSRRGGSEGRLAISTAGFDIGLRQTASAQDAIIEVGETGSAVLHRSSDNVFDDVITGLSFTAKEASGEPITLSVQTDNSAVLSRVRGFAEAYNRLTDRVGALTVFNESTQSVGLLFGSGDVLRIQSEFGGLLSGRIGGAGDIKSLGEIGLRLTENGRMEFNAEKLSGRLESDPEAVKEFFTKETTGLAARVKNSVDKIAGAENGLLINRNQALASRIETNNGRIATLNERLTKEEARLYVKFNAMEQAIARLQSNQTAISNILPLSTGN